MNYGNTKKSCVNKRIYNLQNDITTNVKVVSIKIANSRMIADCHGLKKDSLLNK